MPGAGISPSLFHSKMCFHRHGEAFHLLNVLTVKTLAYGLKFIFFHAIVTGRNSDSGGGAGFGRYAGGYFFLDFLLDFGGHFRVVV